MPRAASVRVWDPLVRVAHWSLAVAVIGAYALGDDGGKWHEALGYGALAIVAVRLLWGAVGSRYARFRDFVRPPAAVAEYSRELLTGAEPRYVGHNPLGGWWILLLLGLVAAAGASGWALSLLGEEEHHWLEELHEGVSNGLIAAVAIHLAGVAWESLRHGENLARAMLTGRKRPPQPGDR
jgi:cytochrome b